MNKYFMIAERYATALFDLSSKQKAVAATAEELLAIQKLFDHHDILSHSLETPAYSREQQWAALEKILAKLKPSKLVMNFMGVLTTSRRLSALTEIITHFEGLRLAAEGAVKVHVTSAHKLSAAQQKSLAQQLEKKLGKKALLDVTVDASLLNGLKIQVGSKIIDSSLVNKLNRLKHTLKGE